MRRGASPAAGRRRQWGSDRRAALPAVPPPVTKRALTLARLAVVVTAVAWLAFVLLTIWRAFLAPGGRSTRFEAEAVSYLLIVSFLTVSALAYLITRLGYLERVRTHRRVPRAVLDAFYEHSIPSLTTIVPSYREEARVVRTTLLSAALQEYPDLRVVLLVDDPPEPASAAHRELLEQARALPAEIEALLAEPAATFSAALGEFESMRRVDTAPTVADMDRLVAGYELAVEWLRRLAAGHEIVDHTDTFFVEQVVGRLSSDFRLVADALQSAADEGVVLPEARLRQLYRRLAWTFRAEVSSFERKRYACLSSLPNKAMNLNSYIGLMGGAYREEHTAAGLVLVPTAPGPGALVVPAPDYVLTLDADSVLLPEYCLRLVELLERPGNERVAVAQTPYSAYPGSATRLERIAGATTDIQHQLHQGLTHFGATFWVGANAVLRKRALDDICQVELERGWEVRRFIQDRTVIEDTESSIDLGLRGWTLYNYPERLSYSATPPDFGSLCIQRQRWADGGLLILPKLWRDWRLRRRSGSPMPLSELLLRLNYMASIAWASVSLVVILVYPYDDRLLSPLVFAAAAPYFVAMASDLRRCGYGRLDVARIYGFNLILLPVNLSGVFHSVAQAVSGHKVPFKRTPKIRHRTTAALWFVVVPYLLVVISAFTVLWYVRRGRWENAGFATLNTVLAAYAIAAFIGLRDSVVDVWANVADFVMRPVVPETATPAPLVAARRTDWASVLHYGTADTGPDAPPVARPGRETAVGVPRALDPGASGARAPLVAGDGRRLPEGLAALVRDLAAGGPVRVRVEETGEIVVALDEPVGEGAE